MWKPSGQWLLDNGIVVGSASLGRSCTQKNIKDETTKGNWQFESLFNKIEMMIEVFIVRQVSSSNGNNQTK